MEQVVYGVFLSVCRQKRNTVPSVHSELGFVSDTHRGHNRRLISAEPKILVIRRQSHEYQISRQIRFRSHQSAFQTPNRCRRFTATKALPMAGMPLKRSLMD
jgi:hypothetical protein